MFGSRSIVNRKKTCFDLEPPTIDFDMNIFQVMIFFFLQERHIHLLLLHGDGGGCVKGVIDGEPKSALCTHAL